MVLPATGGARVVAAADHVIKWTSEWNKIPKPFVWTKTADEILETLAAYCNRINDLRQDTSVLPQGQQPGTLGGPPAESGRNASTRCCP
jgi:hypothetical protein